MPATETAQTLEQIESALDATEARLDDILESTAEAVTVVRNNPILLAAVAVLGASLGAAGGYYFTKKKLRLKYEIIAQEEIRQAKEFYSRLNKTDENNNPLTPQQVAEERIGRDAVEAFKNYSGETETPVDTEEELEGTPPQPVTIVNNIFTNASPIDDGEFNYEIELQRRESSPNEPYVISHDEYFEGEKDYEQASLTYYEGDQVLADSQDDVVPAPDTTVGDDNLMRFGHGSKDANIVYIRNDILNLDFEVVRSAGKYSEEVLGFTDESNRELRHSHSSGLRRFRRYDE